MILKEKNVKSVFDSKFGGSQLLADKLVVILQNRGRVSWDWSDVLNHRKEEPDVLNHRKRNQPPQFSTVHS